MPARLLRLPARLPLSWFHAAGAVLGWIVYRLAPRYAGRLRENLAQSGLAPDAAAYRKLLRRAVAEAGKGVAELIPVWFRSAPEVDRLVTECDGWQRVEEALARGRGIIFLTPHLGCFEISALYAAARIPITVLYRPPKLAWLEPLMIAGRKRGRAQLVPTDLRGVRALLKALKRGEAVGLLPDQAPGAGEGVWADFFGRPAYTMTLAGRLQEASGAQIILAFAERLPHGRGYHLHLETFAPPAGEEPERALNAALEKLIARCPAQYLWSYNRYKTPAGAPRSSL